MEAGLDIDRSYRPEIDGLRALAVLAVILYHSDIKLIPGGFIGVDIFFVISGYLITQIIYSELSVNNFSIINFYERRFRRILPAFLSVTFFTALLGSLILTPGQLKDLAKVCFPLICSHQIYIFI